MAEKLLLALQILGKGMAGIFTVMFIVMLTVWLLQKVSTKKKDN